MYITGCRVHFCHLPGVGQVGHSPRGTSGSAGTLDWGPMWLGSQSTCHPNAPWHPLPAPCHPTPLLAPWCPLYPCWPLMPPDTPNPLLDPWAPIPLPVPWCTPDSPTSPASPNALWYHCQSPIAPYTLHPLLALDTLLMPSTPNARSQCPLIPTSPASPNASLHPNPQWPWCPYTPYQPLMPPTSPAGPLTPLPPEQKSSCQEWYYCR